MSALRPTVDGVLIPDELLTATLAEQQQEYAARVKRGNRAFVDACFAIEDRAAKLGVTVDPWGSDPDRTTRHWRPVA